MADIRDFRNKNTTFTGTDGISLPSGNTAQRPSGITGQTRYNTDTGSLEFYDGANWVATNLIPTIDSISGTIYQGQASNITLTLTNATDAIDVVYSEGGIELAQDIGVSVSAGSATSAVPAAVYNQTVGDTISISIKNEDGTPSSNSVTRTIQGLPTGGTISNVGSYRVHTFTDSGTFTVPSGFTGTADMLLVAGGGAGGGNLGGGGGAGGMIEQTGISLSSSTNTITIGAGGPRVQGSQNTPPKQNGNASTALGYTAVAGGAGSGGTSVDPNSGGSGGGQSGYRGGFVASGTSGQGNSGGSSAGGGSNYPGGGGGGRGAAGTSRSSNTDRGGDGGTGSQNNYDGNNYYYAGGGGGGSYQGSNGGGNGGTGGGGGGGTNNGTPGTGGGSARNSGQNGSQEGNTGVANNSGGNGGANTGGGGGGSGHQIQYSGAGGKGICVIRYQI